jgi:hypothetical protein
VVVRASVRPCPECALQIEQPNYGAGQRDVRYLVRDLHCQYPPCLLDLAHRDASCTENVGQLIEPPDAAEIQGNLSGCWCAVGQQVLRVDRIDGRTKSHDVEAANAAAPGHCESA